MKKTEVDGDIKEAPPQSSAFSCRDKAENNFIWRVFNLLPSIDENVMYSNRKSFKATEAVE